jgi:hypothetical protein
MKDGNYNNGELHFFSIVVGYCCSEKKARSFSPEWNKISNHEPTESK